MRLLINASNLTGGGGSAVAASVIAEVERFSPEVLTTVLSSPPVDEQLHALGGNRGRLEGYFVLSRFKSLLPVGRLPVNPVDFDVVLNLFGPIYNLRLARNSVTGLAQPWVAFPENLAWERLSRGERISKRLKLPVQALCFRLPAILVVEQQAVRDALLSQPRFAHTAIEVVPSAVDNIHFEPGRWDDITLEAPAGSLRIGLVARNNPHKNMAVLPDVKHLVEEALGIPVKIFVTFSAEEWRTAPESFRSNVTNVGRLTLAQCPSFYRNLDAVVFPTLLECFSALPIEVRAAGVPLFASDLQVIRETVGDYATYFDPLSPQSIAHSIVTEYRANGLARQDPQSIESVRFSARDRAEGLIAVCRRTMQPASYG